MLFFINLFVSLLFLLSCDKSFVNDEKMHTQKQTQEKLANGDGEISEEYKALAAKHSKLAKECELISEEYKALAVEHTKLAQKHKSDSAKYKALADKKQEEEEEEKKKIPTNTKQPVPFPEKTAWQKDKEFLETICKKLYSIFPENSYQSLMAKAKEMKIPPKYSKEMQDVATSYELDFDQILFLNTYLDIAETFGCTTFAILPSRSNNNKLLMGRNLDYQSFNILYESKTVYYDAEDQKNFIISISWPGLVGVLSAMNRHGLSLAIMEVTYDKFAPHMPYPMIMRQILESCKNVEDVKKFMREHEQDISSSFQFMAVDINRAIVVEASLNENNKGITAFREPGLENVLKACNHFEKLREMSPTVGIEREIFFRKEMENINKKYDIADIKKILKVTALGSNLQSMIFIPSEYKILLALGSKKLPAVDSEYCSIEFPN